MGVGERCCYCCCTLFLSLCLSFSFSVSLTAPPPVFTIVSAFVLLGEKEKRDGESVLCNQLIDTQTLLPVLTKGRRRREENRQTVLPGNGNNSGYHSVAPERLKETRDSPGSRKRVACYLGVRIISPK